MKGIPMKRLFRPILTVKWLYEFETEKEKS